MFLRITIDLSSRHDAATLAFLLKSKRWKLFPDRDCRADQVMIDLGYLRLAEFAEDLSAIVRDHNLSPVPPPEYLAAIAPVTQTEPRAADPLANPEEHL